MSNPDVLLARTALVLQAASNLCHNKHNRQTEKQTNKQSINYPINVYNPDVLLARTALGLHAASNLCNNKHNRQTDNKINKQTNKQLPDQCLTLTCYTPERR